jgi:hypothetical protein
MWGWVELCLQAIQSLELYGMITIGDDGFSVEPTGMGDLRQACSIATDSPD